MSDRSGPEAAPVPARVGCDSSSVLELWWSSSINGAELDATEYPPLSYLVTQLLPEGSLVLLAGPPKVGKSYLATGVACGVATGGLALDGLECVGPHEVLMVSLDDQSRARMKRRLREVLRGRPIPANLTIHTEPNLGNGAQAAGSLIAYLNHRPGTRLVIVDTLQHLRGRTLPGEAAYAADVRFLAELRQVLAVHPKVTLLVLTHTRKSLAGQDDDPIAAVSGTHGVTGGADALLVVTGKRGIPRRMLDVIGRDAEDSRLVLAWTDHGLSLTDDDPDDPTVFMTKDDAAVYNAVKDCAQPVSAKDLDVVVDMPKIGNRLSKLATAGYLKKTGRGLYEVA